jgi:hypothetical protein
MDGNGNGNGWRPGSPEYARALAVGLHGRMAAARADRGDSGDARRDRRPAPAAWEFDGDDGDDGDEPITNAPQRRAALERAEELRERWVAAREALDAADRQARAAWGLYWRCIEDAGELRISAWSDIRDLPRLDLGADLRARLLGGSPVAWRWRPGGRDR